MGDKEVVAGESIYSIVCPSSYPAADGKLLVMTPVDPAFLLIPILKAAHPV